MARLANYKPKPYPKVKWLSCWQPVITLCNSLKNVITYLSDNADVVEGEVGPVIYSNLHNSSMLTFFIP